MRKHTYTREQIDRWVAEMGQYARNAGTRGVRVPDSMGRLIEHFEIRGYSQEQTWNALIDALDQYDPNWRGWPAPMIQVKRS